MVVYNCNIRPHQALPVLSLKPSSHRKDSKRLHAYDYMKKTLKSRVNLIKQVGVMKGNEIRPFLMSHIMIPIRLYSIPIHSSGICMLGPDE